jgi:hypothetical protein
VLLLSELASVCTLKEPPDLTREGNIHAEIEAIDDSAQNRLQTAMFYYYGARDPSRAVEKARAALSKARETEESSVIYRSLALIGRGLLDLGETAEPAEILHKLEQRILERKKCVPGDETCFLESTTKHRVGLETAKRIAKLIGPHCREEQFVRRLKALAD